MRRVFLTGATGVIGSALVPLLLTDPDSEVYVLIRAASAEHLQQRLEELFRFWEQNGQSVDRRRVIPLMGDVTVPHFGLEKTTYDGLQKTITVIIHSAADVRMNLSLSDARHSAVKSAQNVIEFASSCKVLHKMEIVSTVGVAGKTPGLILEQPLIGNRDFHSTYEQAKAEAEELFFAAQQLGLPITVHRPSMVVADSRTGKSIRRQIFYYLCKFLSGRQTCGLLPDFCRVRLDIIPVDYVAGAIYLSSHRIDTIGRVFHLCGGSRESIAVKELATRVRQANQSRRERVPVLFYLPLPIYRWLLHLSSTLTRGKQKRSLENLSLFLEHAEDSQVFDNRESEKFFSSIGLPIPPTTSYLARVI